MSPESCEIESFPGLNLVLIQLKEFCLLFVSFIATFREFTQPSQVCFVMQDGV